MRGHPVRAIVRGGVLPLGFLSAYRRCDFSPYWVLFQLSQGQDDALVLTRVERAVFEEWKASTDRDGR